ncbi:MAG: SLC13 family permease [Candidatus Omnitrophica bacterium]|jgi:Na+/H+ antiporter NhaD/arsenite permease-like protein|nr:SLC13 family permease [Candidatus Omnitrophota bacterium]MDD3987545.1 SLC13 family permease [Candidatus Omnitrophota bacterium]
MKNIALRLGILLLISFSLWVFANKIGMNAQQALSIAIFSMSILGTLFFWDFRLSFAFVGTAVLLITKTIDIEHLLIFSSLEVILFLIGMMVIMGRLKDSGVFAWIVSVILRIPRLTGKRFVFIVAVLSGIFAGAVDEVTSIIFMVAAVLEVCDYFEVNPTPFIIISVLSTNIGSAATVLGNPIGILIASKSGLTFEDFIVKAMPIAALCLLVTSAMLVFWYRKPIALLDKNIKEFGANEILTKLISVPADKRLKINMLIFFLTLIFISLHHRIEVALGLASNTVLVAVPLISSGLIMVWKRNKARKYIEKDVEWWTLIFFLLLFVQAGTLKYTNTTVFIADKLVQLTGDNISVLTSVILWISALGSSMFDNVVLVAAFIPVLQGFQAINITTQSLWWALLFGGCLGGNITLIGSTANIVALGILEKERNIRMTFFSWFWVGLSVGLITTCIVWAALTFIPFYR